MEVIENYLRVMAAETIRKGVDKADKQQYKEAQEDLDYMIGYIEGQKRARKEKMEPLVNDLKQCRDKCKPVEYHYGGKKGMKMAEKGHGKQGNFHYQNTEQVKMVEDARRRK